MPLRLERSHQNQRIEVIVTANVGLVWSRQHLEHNAQRQNAPTHSTHYLATTIEGGKNSIHTKLLKQTIRDLNKNALFIFFED